MNLHVQAREIQLREMRASRRGLFRDGAVHLVLSRSAAKLLGFPCSNTECGYVSFKSESKSNGESEMLAASDLFSECIDSVETAEDGSYSSPPLMIGGVEVIVKMLTDYDPFDGQPVDAFVEICAIRDL